MMCMGVLSSAELCKVSNEETGMPGYVSFALDFAKWVNRQHFVVQLFVAMLFLLFTIPCMGLESTFGASWVVTSLLASAGFLVIYKVNGHRVDKKRKAN